MSQARAQDSEPRPVNGSQLRIGVLCDGPRLAAWQIECLAKVRQLPFATVAVFVIHKDTSPPKAPLLTRLYRKFSSGLFLWRAYERLVLNRKVPSIRVGPIPVDFEQVPRLEVSTVQVGKFRQSLDEKSLETLRTFKIDVLLRFGFGILTGEILSLPRSGVWSFHHGDPEHFRGAPPGFWEIHNGAPVTGVILQRLTEKLDGGVVLHAGWFKTNTGSYPKTLERILQGANHFVARALVDLWHNPQAVSARIPIENCGPVYRYPRTGAVIRFMARSAKAWIADQFHSLVRHQQWTLGVVDKPLGQLFDVARESSCQICGVSWFPEVRGRFLADPFPIGRGNLEETVILAEEFDWDQNIGRIAEIRWTDSGVTRPHRAICSEHHLSYPYTVEYSGEVYCIPECAAASEVALHRFEAHEQRWIRAHTIIEGFPALDPTIFFHDARWWMFCTNAETGPNEFLYAWHAKDLFGPWESHPANPLKVDIRSARPAGRPFVHQGELIRPAQDCSIRYGGGISFNRVTKLSEIEFTEEPAGALTAAADTYEAGLHTICAAGAITIVDGARFTFIASEFWRALRRKFGGRRGACS